MVGMFQGEPLAELAGNHKPDTAVACTVKGQEAWEGLSVPNSPPSAL